MIKEFQLVDKAKKVLKMLEWSKTYSYDTGWPCCPICNGIKPGHGEYQGEYPINSDHREGCLLKEAING